MKTFICFLMALGLAQASLVAQLPTITNQPASQTVGEGSNVTFTVGVSGPGPFSYEWLLNSNTILTSGIITTVAGNGVATFAGDGGAATNASLNGPFGLAFDASGDLFIADAGNNRIRKVDTNGIITTVAGNGTAGYSGDGGPATNASLDVPVGVAVDAAGNLYIADRYNNRIRRVDTNGIITTVVGQGTGEGWGSGSFSGDGGPATNASLNNPDCVAFDSSGNLFIGDLLNSRIRKVDTNGIITTVAGDGTAGYSGDGGPATNASLSDLLGLDVAVDASGNLFIADGSNNRVRKVDTNGIITTVAGIGGTGGFSGDGGAATNASLNNPAAVAVNASGDLFIADYYNNRIREVNANGIITTIAGGGAGGGSDGIGDGGLATNATTSGPGGIALDGAGNLFIADYGDNRIRKVALADSPTLTLKNVTADNAGNYQVIVTSPYGSVTSRVASLTVLVPPRAARAIAIETNGFVIGITIIDGGYGYTNTPLVRFIGGGGSGAQAVAVVSNGVVTAINVLNAGSGYTNAPLVVIDPPFIPNPVLSLARVSVLSFTNLNIGSSYQLQQSFQWYWTNQSDSFTATNTVYTQAVSGESVGGDYRLALAPVPNQAFATDQLYGNFVIQATVTGGGSGYVSAPAVSLVGGGGSGATAIAQISAGMVTNIEITDAGGGYTNTPIVEIAPPPVVALSPTILPALRLDATSLAPYDNYQIEFTPGMAGGWTNWEGGLFTPTNTTHSQDISLPGEAGFFRLQYAP